MGGRPQAPSSWGRPYQIRWRDLDASGHVANSAFLDLCSDARFAFLSEAGFGPRRFAEHEVGLVVFRDEITYVRELRLLDIGSVTLELAGAAPMEAVGG
jgi:acyl-CoA thioester hydrolase